MSNLIFIPPAAPSKPARDFKNALFPEKTTESGALSFEQFIKGANERQVENDRIQEKHERFPSDERKTKPEPKREESKAVAQSHSEKAGVQSKPNQEVNDDGGVKETSRLQVKDAGEKVADENINVEKPKVEAGGDVNQDAILALLAHLAGAEAVIRGETQPEAIQMSELGKVIASVQENVQTGVGDQLEGAKPGEKDSELSIINAVEANLKKLYPETSTEGESLSNQGQNDAKGHISELVKVNSNANLKIENEGLNFDQMVFGENRKAEAVSGIGGNQIFTPHEQSSEKGGKVDLALIQTHLTVNEASEVKTETPVLNIVPSQSSVSSSIQAQTSGTAGATSTSREELFAQLVEHAKVVVKNGGSEMEVNLRPEQLGKLQLKVTIEHEVVTAKFVAESQQVKEIIESNLSQLKRNLQESGMQVDSIMVSVGYQQGNDSFEQAANSREGFNHFNSSTGKGGEELNLAAEETKPAARIDTVIDLIA